MAKGLSGPAGALGEAQGTGAWTHFPLLCAAALGWPRPARSYRRALSKWSGGQPPGAQVRVEEGGGFIWRGIFRELLYVYYVLLLFIYDFLIEVFH